MGEYADDYFRKEVMSEFGFDPGSMYRDDDQRQPKPGCKCEICGKRVKVAGLSDHQRDAHGISHPSSTRKPV